MPRVEILKNIDKAFANAKFAGTYWEGTTKAGMTIGGYIDKNGNKATAFPVIKCN